MDLSRAVRWIFGSATLLVLGACMTVPQSRPCDRAEACLISELMAAEMSDEVGSDIGGGILFRNVQAAGALVVVDIELPIPVAQLEPVQKRALHDVNAQGFIVGFCGPQRDGDGPDLFEFGNAFQVRTFGNDGAVAGASTIESCGA